ncbi:MAG: adenylate kinase [Bacteroidota bacterium]
MNIVLLGRPGAGKGTQSLRCQQRYNLTSITPGDLMRQEAQRGTPLGNIFSGYLDAGDLAPDNMVMALVEKRIAAKASVGGLLFDGCPRAMPQAMSLERLLDAYDLQLDAVLLLDVAEAEVKKRIAERSKTSNRSDDRRVDKVMHRIQVYEQETRPVLDYYEKQGKLFRIDGMGSTEEVFQRMVEVLDGVK